MKTILPDHIAKLVDPKTRKEMGISTAEETLVKGEATSERQLQGQIVNLLRLKGIEPLWHRTDKRSAATIGWPDITFCYQRPVNEKKADWLYRTYPCCWEIKMPNGILSKEQSDLKLRLENKINGWNYRVIRSVDEAVKELREMGIN